MPRLYLSVSDQQEYFEAACNNLTADFVAACEEFRRRLGEIGYTASEINAKIREELEDVKDAFR